MWAVVDSTNMKRAISRMAAAIAVIILVVVAGGGIYYFTTTGPTSNVTTVKIGIVEPLTGSYAIFGTEAVAGAQIAIDHINAAGGIKNMGGAKLELLVQDSQSTIDGAKAAAQKLVSVDQVKILLGAYISRQTLGMLAVTDPAKVLTVIDGIVDYLTASNYSYVFRVAPKQSVYAITAAQFVHDQALTKNLTIKRVVILNEDSIFGKMGALGFEQQSLTYQWNVVDRVEYSSDITDMTAIVQRVINDKPDVVFSVPYFTDGVLFAKTAQTLGLKPMFIAGAGASGYADPQSIQAGGSAVNYYTMTYGYNPMKNTPANNKFVDDFKAKYNRLPTDSSGEIYYSVWVVKEALEQAATLNPSDPLNGDTLKKAMLSLDLTTGPAAETYPTGHIKFMDNGDNQYGGTVVLQVIGNSAYLVYPATGAERAPVFPRPDWTP